MTKFDVVEASIASLRQALEDGTTTSVGLVEAYQARIAAFDGPDTETKLNSVIVANPEALAEAAASDERRAHGQTRWAPSTGSRTPRRTAIWSPA